MIVHIKSCYSKCICGKFYLLFSETELRGRRQLSFVPINGQLAARGGGVEVVVRKSVTKPSATIFYMVIKTTFKKYFYNSQVGTLIST